jgi:hypothetical protein
MNVFSGLLSSLWLKVLGSSGLLVDTLFALGLAINLLKGIDFFLTEKHRKKVQGAAERMTLWLIDVRPLTWFRIVSTPAAVFLLVAISFAGSIVVLYLAYKSGIGYLGAISFSSHKHQGIVMFVVRVLFAGTYLIGSTLSPIIAGIFIFPVIMNWFFDEHHFFVFLGRFFLFLVLGAILTAIMHAFLGSGFFLFDQGFAWVAGARFDPSAPARLSEFLTSSYGITGVSVGSKGGPSLYVLYAIPILVGSLAILSEILLAALAVIVSLMRTVAWRIVIYDKGALAALLLLTTIGLGILQLYLKS